MKDNTKEGIEWGVLILIAGMIAAGSNSWLKLIASLVAVGAVVKAGDCFQVSVTQAYQQLTT